MRDRVVFGTLENSIAPSANLLAGGDVASLNLMIVTEILKKKRDGQANSPQEIQFLVKESVGGRIPDYQIAAWLMAAFLRGLNEAETAALTEAFISSGSILGFNSSIYRVDKHSTGGVGDKTSLIIAPLVASTGLAAVPMISGRGLGHTGGTLDKLEAIPGFRTDLPLAEFSRMVDSVGLGIIGATSDLAPADRIFYSLRDVTATIECHPLIVASILSKKVAAGVDGLVLDVKMGSGAFMKSLEESEVLAEKLVQAGRRLGKRTVAIVSDMSQPLGRNIGNGLEVEEALDVLKGGGPDDLRTVSLELAVQMIKVSRPELTREKAEAVVCSALESGRALEKFTRMVEAQGGDPRVVDDPSLLGGAGRLFEYRSDSSGYLVQVEADLLGLCAVSLGAGRQRAEDPIDPAVGLAVLKKIGEEVEAGEPLVRVHFREHSQLQGVLPYLDGAFEVGDRPGRPPELIRKVMD